MNDTRLHGVQYVRLAPGAAEKVAPYVGAAPNEIQELVLDLNDWPEEIQRSPLRGWDGRLIEGDPVLLDASDAGLLFAGRPLRPAEGGVLVGWERVESLQVLGGIQTDLPPANVRAER